MKMVSLFVVLSFLTSASASFAKSSNREECKAAQEACEQYVDSLNALTRTDPTTQLLTDSSLIDQLLIEVDPAKGNPASCQAYAKELVPTPGAPGTIDEKRAAEAIFFEFRCNSLMAEFKALHAMALTLQKEPGKEAEKKKVAELIRKTITHSDQDTGPILRQFVHLSLLSDAATLVPAIAISKTFKSKLKAAQKRSKELEKSLRSSQNIVEYGGAKSREEFDKLPPKARAAAIESLRKELKASNEMHKMVKDVLKEWQA